MLKFLIIFALFSIYLQFSNPIRVKRQYGWYIDFRCLANETYRENYCNNCICSRGRLGCTKKICSGQWYFMAKYCNVGQTWKETCNDCACTSEYGTVCTTRNCDKHNRPDEAEGDTTTPSSCPECPECPSCNCPTCKPEESHTTEGLNPDCTYPPENYDYYGDGGDGGGGGGGEEGGGEEGGEGDEDEDGDGAPRPGPSGQDSNPDCTYPPEDYDYYGNKRW